MKPISTSLTPYAELSKTDQLKRTAGDVAWHVARGVANALVMAPKNLINKIRGQGSTNDWIISRHEDRVNKRLQTQSNVTQSKATIGNAIDSRFNDKVAKMTFLIELQHGTMNDEKIDAAIQALISMVEPKSLNENIKKEITNFVKDMFLATSFDKKSKFDVAIVASGSKLHQNDFIDNNFSATIAHKWTEMNLISEDTKNQIQEYIDDGVFN